MEVVLSNTSKVVVDVKEGNNMFYLPLDQLLKQQRSVPASSSTGSNDSAATSNTGGSYGTRSRELR